MSLLAASLLFLPAIQGPSVKELLDSQLMDIRRLQNEDGSYGNTVRETAWTVIAMTQGPRSYREDDGPFLRNAVQNLLRAAQGLTLHQRRALSHNNPRLAHSVATTGNRVVGRGRSRCRRPPCR